MLLTGKYRGWLPAMRLGTLFLLLASWGVQVLGLRWGTIQAAQSVNVLGLITGLYLISLLLPFALTNWLDAKVVAALTADLTVVFCLYIAVQFFWSAALQPANVMGHLGGVGILLSLIGIPGAYLPRNHVIGVRLPWTYASADVWRQTNVLGARLFLVMGVASLLAGLRGTTWFNGTLLTGLIGVTLLTIGYARWLYQQPHH